MKDYYKILQVAPDASTEVIQMAYKALAKKYHPDLNPGQEEAAQEKMKDVNEAYEILSDKDKRWQYDQIYSRQEKTEQKTSYSAPEPPKGAQSHSAQSRGEQTSAAPVDPTPEDKEKTSSTPRQRELFPDLSEEEEKVVGLLKSRPDGLQINTLVVDTNIPVNRMSALLFELEMKGVLRVLAGGIYRLL